MRFSNLRTLAHHIYFVRLHLCSMPYRHLLSFFITFGLAFLLGAVVFAQYYSGDYLPALGMIKCSEPTSQALSKTSESADPKIFAFIHTFPDNHKTRAKAVEETWAKRINDYVFTTIEEDDALAKKWVISFANDEHNKRDRIWLWNRVRSEFQRTYKEKYHNFDWFMKADDDCYYVIENIKKVLSKYNSSEPWYLGELVAAGGNVYPSGGTGYILSKAALKKFAHVLENPSRACTNITNEMEDINIGSCFKAAGLKVIPTVNEKMEHEMIPINLRDMMGPVVEITSNFFNWYHRAAVLKPITPGPNCCSSNLMAVHYVTPQDMFVYDYLLYKVKVAGLRNEL